MISHTILLFMCDITYNFIIQLFCLRASLFHLAGDVLCILIGSGKGGTVN